MKTITLNNLSDVENNIKYLSDAANKAKINILELSKTLDGIKLLEEIKFNKIGCDPLNTQRHLNLIEQINQTFTYMASFRAVKILFKKHPEATEFILNLGTASGTDIESASCGGIAAEVFSATKPSSNDKLNKDIKKVSTTKAAHKYVFFLCPDIEAGSYVKKSTKNVMVWSLGK